MVVGDWILFGLYAGLQDGGVVDVYDCGKCGVVGFVDLVGYKEGAVDGE